MKLKQVVWIDYAHRLQDSKHLITKKCLNLHGHTGKITIELESKKDKRNGMVIDFTALKDIVMEFDHKTILNLKDPLFDILWKENPKQIVGISENPTIQ